VLFEGVCLRLRQSRRAQGTKRPALSNCVQHRVVCPNTQPTQMQATCIFIFNNYHAAANKVLCASFRSAVSGKTPSAPDVLLCMLDERNGGRGGLPNEQEHARYTQGHANWNKDGLPQAKARENSP